MSAKSNKCKHNGVQTQWNPNGIECEHERVKTRKGVPKREQKKKAIYRSHSLVSKYSGEYRKMEIGTRVIVVL